MRWVCGSLLPALPANEQNPLAAKGTDHDSLLCWQACKEAKELNQLLRAVKRSLVGSPYRLEFSVR